MPHAHAMGLLFTANNLLLISNARERFRTSPKHARVLLTSCPCQPTPLAPRTAPHQHHPSFFSPPAFLSPLPPLARPLLSLRIARIPIICWFLQSMTESHTHACSLTLQRTPRYININTLSNPCPYNIQANCRQYFATTSSSNNTTPPLLTSPSPSHASTPSPSSPLPRLPLFPLLSLTGLVSSPSSQATGPTPPPSSAATDVSTSDPSTRYSTFRDKADSTSARQLDWEALGMGDWGGGC